jgi:hypothetical protein
MPLALLVFGVAAAVLVAIGRLPFGEATAIQSRYATISLIALAGAYLILIRTSDELRPPVAWFVRAAMILLVCCASIVSTHGAVQGGRDWRVEKGIGAMILLNAEREPRFKIERTLCWSADIVLEQARKLKSRSLSVFAAGSDAIPKEAMIYSSLPASLRMLQESHPAERTALQRLWDDYVTRPDLHVRIPVTSPMFAIDLIGWAAAFARSGNESASPLAEHAAAFARLDAEAGRDRRGEQ